MNEEDTKEEQRSNVPPWAWVLLGAAIVLVLASFTGDGTGMFGWGWMMGMMWLWMLMPLLVVIWLVVYLTDRDRGGPRGRD